MPIKIAALERGPLDLNLTSIATKMTVKATDQCFNEPKLSAAI